MYQSLVTVLCIFRYLAYHIVLVNKDYHNSLLESILELRSLTCHRQAYKHAPL